MKLLTFLARKFAWEPYSRTLADAEPAPAADAVARALYYRFLKRTTAHIMNFLTALVHPLDRLDYYDEAKEDRT